MPIDNYTTPLRIPKEWKERIAILAHKDHRLPSQWIRHQIGKAIEAEEAKYSRGSKTTGSKDNG